MHMAALLGGADTRLKTDNVTTAGIEAPPSIPADFLQNGEDEMENNAYKEEFLRIYNQNLSGRPGASDFLSWLSTTDFFTAPASSKYHLSKPGGLVEHSVNVYLLLKQLMKDMEPAGVWNIESVTICGLLHDVCKANYYVRGAEQSYTVNEQFIYGHGEKSVYLIQKHMELTDEEAVAIRFHMGSWIQNDANNASKAFADYPLAFWLHVADEAATFITEKED